MARSARPCRSVIGMGLVLPFSWSGKEDEGDEDEDDGRGSNSRLGKAMPRASSQPPEHWPQCSLAFFCYSSFIHNILSEYT